MRIRPVVGSPALSFSAGGERVLVVADLHLGMEGELAEKGISLPSQIPSARRRLEELVRTERPHRLVFLGDVKHNVPTSTWREWAELPSFFEALLEAVERVEVVKGNHDGDIEGMIPHGVRVHDPGGMRVGEVGLLHGHTWPSRDLWGAKVLVCAHSHPAVEFRDPLGGRVVAPVWLRGKLDTSLLPPERRKGVEGHRKVVVLPAFGELVGGYAVNGPSSEELLGPLFRCGAVRMEEMEAFLLDGTYLGKVGGLPGKPNYSGG
ncbi:MAG: metallophosphoesterase [Candidatus Hadarchaeales archaeon]